MSETKTDIPAEDLKAILDVTPLFAVVWTHLYASPPKRHAMMHWNKRAAVVFLREVGQESNPILYANTPTGWQRMEQE